MKNQIFLKKSLFLILSGIILITMQSFQDSDEQGIKDMVNSMHDSFQELIDTEDNKVMLQYFLPKFMTQSIMIDEDNNGQVGAFTHENYEEYLDGISLLEGVDLTFNDVKFLDIEVKDGIYFNVVYKCLMNANWEDETIIESSIIVTITGKRVRKDWKIANHSVVSFHVTD